MSETWRFMALLVPYAVFSLTLAVFSAAFVVPDFVFEFVGSAGLIVTGMLGVASLFVIFRSSRSLITAGQRVIDERRGRH